MAHCQLGIVARTCPAGKWSDDDPCLGRSKISKLIADVCSFFAESTPPANRLATAEIGPSLHNRSTSIEAVGAPISSLHRRPDLMAQGFFDEVARKLSIFSPSSKSRPESVWGDWAVALGIDPTRLAKFVAVHALQ